MKNDKILDSIQLVLTLGLMVLLLLAIRIIIQII